ncbi:unnamed protein product, partial [Polarella glacialis]
VEGVRLLVTNAHAVHHANLVELQRPGEDMKFLARVICEGPDCDLALLELIEGEEDFWEGVEPYRLCRELPGLNDKVHVCGYPVGGENASITQGVISRVDMQPYRHGSASLLAIQIDAAINPGNSGGPALDEQHRCVGVAFQSLQDAENIGYVIPAEVIQQFVRGYLHSGTFRGFGNHGFAWQPLENPALRHAVLGGMAWPALQHGSSSSSVDAGAQQASSASDPALQASNTTGTGGVLVKRIEPTSPASKLLKERDVLLSIGGKPIGFGGTVHFRRRERIAFPYVTSRLFPGDHVALEVLRDGQVHSWQLELGWPLPLVPMHPLQPPAYVVFGGLVFVPLSEPYLRSEWGELFEERAPVALADPWLRNIRCFGDEEVVVLSCIFASPLTAGLTHFMNRRLLSCNGCEVRNLAHLAKLLDEAAGTNVLFKLDDDDIIALPTEQARATTQQVLETNRIPAGRCLPLV